MVQLDQQVGTQPFPIGHDDMHHRPAHRLLKVLDDREQLFAEARVSRVRLTVEHMSVTAMQIELFQTGVHFVAGPDEALGHGLLGP